MFYEVIDSNCVLFEVERFYITVSVKKRKLNAMSLQYLGKNSNLLSSEPLDNWKPDAQSKGLLLFW